MNQQEQRIAIAQACGWDYHNRHPIHGKQSVKSWYYRDSNITVSDESSLPDYVKDLNEMHEAEEALHNKNHAQLCVVYRDYLNEFMERDQSHVNAQGLGYHATAAQRAEAFLRTLNLWKE
jgi:hypothetical protein